jgi:hypothetical protein
LESTMTAANITQIWDVADMHNCLEFKEQTHAFISK